MKRRDFIQGAITFVSVTTFPQLSSADHTFTHEIDQSLGNQLLKTYNRGDLNNLSNNEQQTIRNNRRQETSLVSNNQDWGQHIVKVWHPANRDTSEANIRHVEKCPLCNKSARDLVNGTRLYNVSPRLDIPRHWRITGLLFVRDDNGYLYPANELNGRRIGPQEGLLWMWRGQYIGINNFGKRFSAIPV